MSGDWFGLKAVCWLMRFVVLALLFLAPLLSWDMYQGGGLERARTAHIYEGPCGFYRGRQGRLVFCLRFVDSRSRKRDGTLSWLEKDGLCKGSEVR